MANHTTVDYNAEKGSYYKVLFGLLALTAWIILMYYMHLKGETLIGWTVVFAVFITAFFFGIVMIDVNNFQFADVSHITSPAQ